MSRNDRPLPSVSPLVRLVAIAAASALALAACANKSDDKAESGDVSKVDVTLTGGGADACKLSSSSAKAGPVTFTVTNKSSTAITEIELLQDQKILGEKENLAPGLAPAKFTVTLEGGDYKIYCPGAETELTDFKVTGKAAAASTSSAATLLNQGAKEYATYVNAQAASMLTATRKLQSDIDAGNLAEAQSQYGRTRPYYERMESAVDGFIKPGFKATDNAGNLDYLVDMRASNLDPKVGWHGFHAVEKDLFQAKKITENTKKLAAELTRNVALLNKVVPTLSYKPEDLANGAAGLLDEAGTNKVTGEEEAYSHIDLVDLAANVEGASQAFAYLEPGLKKIDPTLTEKINTQFTVTNTMLDTYRDASDIGGYARYTPEFKAKHAAAISARVQALQDPLANLAAKVATA